MGTLIMAGQLILSLSILVALHELGHFAPAKWFKTRVEKYYLFFNPGFALLRGKKLDGKWQVKTPLSAEKGYSNDDPDTTEYGLGWLPFGGYVKIAGMIDESFDKEQMAQEPQPWEFRTKPAWQRLIIMLGGVIVNFILGFAIYAMVLSVWGTEFLPAENAKYGVMVDDIGRELGLQNGDKILAIGDQKFVEFGGGTLRKAIAIDGAQQMTVERNGVKETLSIPESMANVLSSYDSRAAMIIQPRMPFVIGGMAPDYPAMEAGLELGDQVVGVNGKEIQYYDEFAAAVTDLGGEQVSIQVNRGTEALSKTLTLTEDGKLGVNPYGFDHFFETSRREYGVLESIPAGIQKGWNFLGTQMKAFGRMFTGALNPADSLGSIITIGREFGDTWIWERFWLLTGFFSLLLGFFNLLPIPGLDGGHVMFLLYEVITGRKPHDRVVEVATTIGFVLLIGLMIFALGNDIRRLF